MNIQARKLNFVQEFLRVADDDLITKLENLLQVERRRKLEEVLTPMTLDQFNKIVDESEDDFANGKTIEAKQLLKQVDSWK